MPIPQKYPPIKCGVSHSTSKPKKFLSFRDHFVTFA
nr:MAG TPA: hypothetical protein [Caudoviricetes sp.]